MPGITDDDRSSKGGRPPKYRDEFADIAYLLILETSACDAKLARTFKVNQAQIKRWKLDRQEFRKRYLDAWDKVNCSGVEAALNKRAMGYWYTETTHEADETGDLRIKKKVKKSMAPDTKAIEMVLRNRDPERWPKSGEEGQTVAPMEVHIHTEPRKS